MSSCNVCGKPFQEGLAIYVYSDCPGCLEYCNRELDEFFQKETEKNE